MIGSIGVLAETSELQRQAYNQDFLQHGLDWYWNVANYCEMLKSPGGLSRLSNFSNGKVSSDLINSIHEKKEFFYGKYLENGIALNKFGIEPHDAIAIEDTEVNQEAALQEQILCYLFAGEYAVTQHNLNAINNLNVAVKPL